MLNSTQLPIKTKMLINQNFFLLLNSQMYFITLINVKMLTIVGIFNMYEYDIFYSRWS